MWPDTGSKSVFFAKSTDGGTTFSTPRLVAKTFATFQITLPAIAKRAALVGASVAAFNNNVYVAWVDLSGENGCTAPNNEPGVNVGSNCTSRIWFARSADGGQTFSQPIKVNPTADKSDQFNQACRRSGDRRSWARYYGTGTGANGSRPISCSVLERWRPDLEHAGDQGDDGVSRRTGGRRPRQSVRRFNGCRSPRVSSSCWTDRRLTEAIFTARITVRQNAQVFEPNVAAAGG